VGKDRRSPVLGNGKSRTALVECARQEVLAGRRLSSYSRNYLALTQQVRKALEGDGPFPVVPLSSPLDPASAEWADGKVMLKEMFEHVNDRRSSASAALAAGPARRRCSRPDCVPSRSNSFLLIDTTGTAHPQGSSNPGQWSRQLCRGVSSLYCCYTREFDDVDYGKSAVGQDSDPSQPHRE
jgi:hypothetical protein